MDSEFRLLVILAIASLVVVLAYMIFVALSNKEDEPSNYDEW